MAEHNLDEIVKGVWFWDKRWWWVIAINELAAREQGVKPIETLTITVNEVNAVLDEMSNTFKKRLKAFATMPIRVSLKIDANNLIIKP